MGADCVTDAGTGELHHAYTAFQLFRKARRGNCAAARCPAFCAADVQSLVPATRAAPRRSARRRVLLWPDTFTNHFDPEIARAAVDVLDAAGFEPDVPSEPMCCGRPLYDFGFVDTARKLLEEILENLAPEIYAGTPMIVLEPSCAATFRVTAAR